MKKMIEPLAIYGERNYILLRNMHYVDINPREAGYQECSAGFYEPPHKRNRYILHHITSGKGVFYVEDKKYELSKGDTFLIRPDQEISYRADAENPWSYIWIGFEGKSAKLLDDINADVFKLNPDLFNDIKESLTYVNTRELYVAGCLSKILCKIVDSPKNINITATVKGYIHSGDALALKIADIAAYMNISADRLARIFKAETGETLNSYLLRKKMERGKKLILLNHNVNEVSQELGYSDPTTFCRAYRNFFGYPPSKQKQQNSLDMPQRQQSAKEKIELAQKYLEDGYTCIEVAKIFQYSSVEEFFRIYEKHFGYLPSREGM